MIFFEEFLVVRNFFFQYFSFVIAFYKHDTKVCV